MQITVLRKQSVYPFLCLFGTLITIGCTSTDFKKANAVETPAQVESGYTKDQTIDINPYSMHQGY